MSRFSGKVAIVTGGARGIGAATARRLSGEGASVVVADLERDHAEALVGSIVEDGGAALAVECDVASLEDWTRLANTTIDRFGRLDVVHNNASLFIARPTHELSEADWDRQIAVCLKQVFLSVKTCIGHLQATRGVIVNSSSIHAVMGFAEHAGYDAAKGGICSLTRELAVEYGPEVRVNAVVPGGVLTHIWDEYPPEFHEAFAAQAPAKRLGKPEDIAAAVCFLASSDADYITGESLVVDGGWTITR